MTQCGGANDVRVEDLLDRILDSLEVGLSGCDTRLHFFSETPKFNFRSSKFNFRSTETAKLELEPFLLSDLAAIDDLK